MADVQDILDVDLWGGPQCSRPRNFGAALPVYPRPSLRPFALRPAPIAMMMEQTGPAITKDFFTLEYKPPYTKLEAKRQLMFDFPLIYAAVVDQVLTFNGFQYAKTYKALEEAQYAIDKRKTWTKSSAVKHTYWKDGLKMTVRLRPMKSKRVVPRLYIPPHSLREELTFIQERMPGTSQTEEENLSAQDYPPEQAMECTCCFGESNFFKMAQCSEGHLVCVECLHQYTQEAVFGAFAQLSLSCTSPECTAIYPESELERCLSLKLLHSLERKRADVCLNNAGMEDLVRCSHCSFAAVLPLNLTFFTCPNISCQKSFCRYCYLEQKEHGSYQCSKTSWIGKDDIRKLYEERMTMTRIRKCPNCNAQFTKESGCNKMTCVCTTTMCYLCRTPNITYEHYCNHPRDPGFPCSTCTRCSLWTNTEEDEKRAIAEMEKVSKATLQYAKEKEDPGTTDNDKKEGETEDGDEAKKEDETKMGDETKKGDDPLPEPGINYDPNDFSVFWPNLAHQHNITLRQLPGIFDASAEGLNIAKEFKDYLYRLLIDIDDEDDTDTD